MKQMPSLIKPRNKPIGFAGFPGRRFCTPARVCLAATCDQLRGTTLDVDLIQAGDHTAVGKSLPKPAAVPFGPDTKIQDGHQTPVMPCPDQPAETLF